MRKMTHVEIREMWFKFFTSKHHQIIESAPLIPICLLYTSDAADE